MSIGTSIIPNYEEATNVASEFIASLDNLPNEVQHLLQEITYKEQRSQELQQEALKHQAKYLKSTLKASQPPIVNDINQAKVNIGSRPTSPNGSVTSLPARISAVYAEVDALAEEKIFLAQKIVDLLGRKRAHLDADLLKVRILQGENPEDARAATANISSSIPLTKRHDSLAPTPSSVIQIAENLRHSISHYDHSGSIPLSSGPGYHKKRKINANTSIKLPSPAPVSAPPPTSHSRPRAARSTQVIQIPTQEDELDQDADGDEDFEAEDAEEDLTLYCFCNKQSYGDMIGCDNPHCPYQWFHISCVGVKQPLPDKWYCPECIKNRGAGTEKRKGRKK
ncbi:hypothetical protein CVT24_005773 [Panaeolus cyanescens]|uniref:Chromatin modification-related protein n=1 Tax=Panaeolus cyanescens TaxID=181874 RepID=A0A409V922_9AGAR|nr:hypothetical protein CVT24_005773 [Panaeolus cyanescens]